MDMERLLSKHPKMCKHLRFFANYFASLELMSSIFPMFCLNSIFPHPVKLKSLCLQKRHRSKDINQKRLTNKRLYFAYINNYLFKE